MDRTGQLRLHRDPDAEARLNQRPYRVTDDEGLKMVALVDRSLAAFGIGDVLDALAGQLLAHQNEHGELP